MKQSRNQKGIILKRKKYSSPAWHKKALQETEKRLAEGKEKILDWHIAKKELRKHSE